MQAVWLMDQTGGLLVVSASEPLRWGRGTEGADGEGSDMAGRAKAGAMVEVEVEVVAKRPRM